MITFNENIFHSPEIDLYFFFILYYRLMTYRISDYCMRHRHTKGINAKKCIVFNSLKLCTCLQSGADAFTGRMNKTSILKSIEVNLKSRILMFHSILLKKN